MRTQSKKWLLGAGALGFALAISGTSPWTSAARADRGDGPGDNHRHGRPALTAAQFEALLQAEITRDQAVVAARQAYLTAVTAALNGVTDMSTLTDAQRQALRQAQQTLNAAIVAANQTYRQTVQQILNPTPATISVSNAEASVARSLIRLRFNGALDAASAATASNYTVTAAGNPVVVTSAAYNAHEHAVILGVTTGDLHSGDQVVVTSSTLKDSHLNPMTVNTTITAH